MRKTFKRFASLLTIFILTIMSIVPVHASENTSVVTVTDDLAIQMAERFAKGIGENSNIVANNPRKFYDTTGQAIGYIVNYNLENKPYGYVVFDTTCESLISEYSFGNNSANPYEVIYLSEANVFSEKANTSELYKIAPFEYGIVDNSGKIRTNYGETLEKTVLFLNESRGKDPATWDEVLLDIDRGDIAVVHCGIISSLTGERSGHSMAVEGYATLRAYNSGNTVHTLMVFDGWGDTVRYLNFDFDSWTDIEGTTFNG